MGAPPPGYVQYGGPAQGSVQSSSSLSKAMVILYGLVVAAGALLAFAFFNRKGVVDDILNASGTQSDLDSADGILGLAVILQFLAIVASAILTALWSKRIVSNAKARGVTGVSTGLAAGGWFIPIGWFFVGFNELRKAVKGVGGVSKSLALWQGAFIAQVIVGFFNFNNDDVFFNDPDALDQLNNQALVALAAVAVLAVATFFAAKAAKEIDAAVSGG